jgi:hypothetical protein
LLVDLPRLRNQLVASRARLAAEEAKASGRVNDLRDLMDEMSNELSLGRIDPVRTAALITRAGDRARAGAPVKLPKDKTARLIVTAGNSPGRRCSSIPNRGLATRCNASATRRRAARA